MNITYILGNGFDIQLGLKSRYRDFLKEYVQPIASDSRNIRRFKHYLSNTNNKDLWSNAEKAMGEYLGAFGDDAVDIYIEQIADFQLKMVEYLEREQARCSFVEEKKIRESFLNFILGSFYDVVNRRQTEIMDFFDTVGLADIELTDRSAGSLDKHFLHTYNFLTFNYTNLLDNAIKCSVDINGFLGRAITGQHCYLGTICPVHGTLNSCVIMGVNDVSQLDITSGVLLSDRLKRKLIKPNISQATPFKTKSAQKIIRSSDLIAIYGVSYGVTDNLWWSEIRDWLIEKEGHKLVVFARETDSTKIYSPKLAWGEMDFEEDKRKETLCSLGFSQSFPEFERIMDQVYVIANTKRLDLKKIILPDNPNIKRDTIAASTDKATDPKEV